MTLGESIQYAAVAVAGLVGILAAVASIAVADMQRRTADAVWRRDELVNRYLALKAASHDLTVYAGSGVSSAIQQVPLPSLEHEAAELERKHGALIHAAQEVFIVGRKHTVAVTASVITSVFTGELTPRTDHGIVTSYQETNRRQALDILIEGEACLLASMRKDLGLAGPAWTIPGIVREFNRRKGLRAYRQRLVELKAFDTHANLEELELLRILQDDGVLRLSDRAHAGDQETFAVDAPHFDSQIASAFGMGSGLAGVISLPPNGAPIFMLRSDLSAAQRLASLRRMVSFHRQNYRTVARWILDPVGNKAVLFPVEGT